VEENQAEIRLGAGAGAAATGDVAHRGIIRDLFSDKVDSLLVDSKVLHTEVVQYLNRSTPTCSSG